MYSTYKVQLDGATRSDDQGRGSENEERGDRFVDNNYETSDLVKSKSLNDLKPFYNGNSLDSRMAEIRKSINYIRQNWDKFDEFLASLRELTLEGNDFKNAKIRQVVDNLLTTKRDWLDHENPGDEDVTYDAIKLYTSKEGHLKIFRLCNDIFRREDSITSVETIRNVVFLVELINIDLFNYCVKCPEQNNFRGTVYRGMCLTEAELELFRALRNEPIGRRNIAVPLGLFSASSDEHVAYKFIKQGLKSQKADDKSLRPLVIKINVIGLSPEHVAHYNKRFQGTVLTTICAVDIHKLSLHPDEKEVLLRGPFLLVLDLFQKEVEYLGQSCDILETVMLNDNRDHITTSTKLGDLDTLARDLFGTMVTVTRSEYAIKYCTEKGLTSDVQEYQNILVENRKKLDRLIKQ